MGTVRGRNKVDKAQYQDLKAAQTKAASLTPEKIAAYKVYFEACVAVAKTKPHQKAKASRLMVAVREANAELNRLGATDEDAKAYGDFLRLR